MDCNEKRALTGLFTFFLPGDSHQVYGKIYYKPLDWYVSKQVGRKQYILQKWLVAS